MINKTVLAISALMLVSASLRAQQGYEFEVYDTSIAAPRSAELEIHTNYVPSGSQLLDVSESRATHRAFRTSVEVSTGFTHWLSGSLYAVGYARNGVGTQFVGNRGRLTAIAPTTWNLPFQLGVSQEIGY